VITALSEEIVWRVVFQTILSVAVGTNASIAVVAASFALLHRHRTAGITVQFAELLAFSLILGGLFALTHDVMAVIAVHAIRNYLIGIQGADSEAW
jgi:membrane protease YdiL (CAAX protease family)